MKHSVTRLLLVGIIFFNALITNAQTPLVDDLGATVEHCNAAISNHIFLKQDAKSAIFYLNSYSNNPKLQYQGIVTYNKNTGTSYNENIELPAGYRPLYARTAGDQYLAYYYRFNRANRTFEYATASFPQKKSVSGTRQVTPEVRVAIDVTDRGEILKYTAVSQDESKHAVVFIAPNERNQAPYFYCYIYDNTGKELWYDKFLPVIIGNKFSIQDIALSDKGELLLLLYSVKGKNASMQNPTIQLFTCTKGHIESVDEPVDFGYVNSMKMLRLKNKDIFIGGYYDATVQSNTTGFFTYIYNPDKNKITDKSHEAIEYRNEHTYDGLTDNDYFIKCDYLFELPDKIVLMMGEQHTSIQEHGEKSSLAYRHHTNDVYCNKFTLGGTSLGLLKVNKHLSVSGNSIVTTHDDGERIGNYLINEKNAFAKNPTFANLSLTYFPIVKGNLVYILYADRFSNYAEDANEWEEAVLEKADENCLVVTKVDYSVDKKVVALPGKTGQTFHDVWVTDGDFVFFGMSGKKDYAIKQLKLNGQWTWDK